MLKRMEEKKNKKSRGKEEERIERRKEGRKWKSEWTITGRKKKCFCVERGEEEKEGKGRGIANVVSTIHYVSLKSGTRREGREEL